MAQTQLKGENVGDRSLSHLDIDLSNAPAKATIVAADRFAMVDSADSLLKTASLNVLETYFNSKYSPASHDHAGIYDNYGGWLLTIDRMTASIEGINSLFGYQGMCILPGEGISFEALSNLNNQVQVTINSSAQGMVYPGAGIAVSTGYSWGASIFDSSAKWNQAFTERNNWNGGSTGLVAATGRTSLGLVIGTNVLAQRTFGTAANNASTDFFYKYPSSNSDSWNDGNNHVTDWGLGRPDALPATVYDYGVSIKFQRGASSLQFYAPENSTEGSGELWYRTGYNATKRTWHKVYHNHSLLTDYVAGSTGVVTVGDTLTTALSKLQTGINSRLTGGVAGRLMIWSDANNASSTPDAIMAGSTLEILNIDANTAKFSAMWKSVVYNGSPVIQINANAGIPCKFIDYQGAASATAKTQSISTLGIGSFAYSGMVRIEVNGADRWMPYYT